MTQDALSRLDSLTDVVRRFDLRTHKSLGQNFLLDLNITRKIARSAGDLKGRTVIEIGPGPGGLTRALLLEGAERVIAIEKDARCVAALQEVVTAAQGRLQVLEADALTTCLTPFIQGPTKIVANLPYNIATPLIMSWLQDASSFENFTLMLQKEVGNRFEALPRTKAYGRVSVLAQWKTHVETLFDVPPHVFSPPPKVMSSVVSFTPYTRPLYDVPGPLLDRLLKLSFAHRRKVLRANLKDLSPSIPTLLEKMALSPNIRAEELSLETYCRLVLELQDPLEKL